MKDGAFMKKTSLLLALCILVTFMLTACSEKVVSNDEKDYAEYITKVSGAEAFMPTLVETGEYTSFEATYKHSRVALMYELDTVGLFLTYEDADAFQLSVDSLTYDHIFYEDYPDEQKTDYLAEVGGYSFRMVKAEYELEVYKSALLIGINEEAQKICYLYYYDAGMDALDDLDRYVEEHFYLR